MLSISHSFEIINLSSFYMFKILKLTIFLHNEYQIFSDIKLLPPLYNFVKHKPM